MSLLVVAACGVVPLVSLWQVSRAAAQSVRPYIEPRGAEPLVTPVLSVRRVAPSVTIEMQLAGMRRGLRRLSADLPATSCLLVRSQGRTVTARGEQRALIPGSNMKLLVAATALDVLGAEHRYSTSLRGTLAGRTIIGDLYLVGGGDPHLTTRNSPVIQRYPTLAPTFLDTLVDELVAQGVTTVSGSVVGDGSRYDDERFAPGWGDGIRGVEAGPLGALVVDDGLPLGSLIRRSDPGLAGAESLTALLRARGITVVGNPRAASAANQSTQDESPVLATVVSAPLRQSLANVLANSDNNSAEMLLKEIGVAVRGEGSRIAGLQVVLDRLTTWGLPVEGIALADGSGLDRANQLSCQVLVALLEKEATNKVFFDAMAVAGRSGTLQDVFRTPPARDAIRAKTGTLNAVKALTGRAQRSSGTTEFALVVNDRRASNQAEWLGWWNRLATALMAENGNFSVSDLLPIEKTG